VQFRNPAEGEGAVTRAEEFRRGRGQTGEAQGVVALDGRGDFRRAAGELGPATIGELAGEDMLLAALVLGFLRLARPVVVEDVVANDGAIDDELTFPITARVEAGECLSA
jgi:hypothetical protein